MRKILSITVLICSAIIAGLAQQNSPHKAGIDALLPQLRSNEDGLRAQAYERLKSEPGALQSATVKTALLDLLDRENNGHESAMREHVGVATSTEKAIQNTSMLLAKPSPPLLIGTIRVRSHGCEGHCARRRNCKHAIATIPCLFKKPDAT